MAQLHWFPGHMHKAVEKINEKLKIIDIVIELLDSRAPASSFNDELDDLLKTKKKLIVLSKADLADPSSLKKWEDVFKDWADAVISLSLLKENIASKITSLLENLASQKWEKDRLKGLKPQPIKVMVVGIPNVGKSFLINRLAKSSVTRVSNKPGYTRGEQWIKINKNILLLDTPGVLPMRYENNKKSLNLALIGAFPEDLIPYDDLFKHLFGILKKDYPISLNKRFNIPVINEPEDVLKEVCLTRRLIGKNNVLDTSRAEKVLIKEFQQGLLGKISLE